MPQLNPEGLAQLYNAPLSMTFQADDLRNQLMQGNELANQVSTIKNQYDTQNNPGLVDQTRLENEAKRARLPGLFAESESAGLKTERERATQGDAIKAAQRKFMQDASDHDIKMLENRGQEMAYSSDPAIRSRGLEILRMHKDMIKQRELTADQYAKAIDLEKLRGANQRELAGINNSAGRYQKTGKGGAGSVEDQIRSGKLSYEKAATLLAGAAFMAEQEGDDETADKYRTMADDFNAKHIASKRAGAQGSAESKPDLGKLGIQPNAPVPAEKFNKVNKDAVPAGLKDNGDGTFTMPDGRIVRRKQQ